MQKGAGLGRKRFWKTSGRQMNIGECGTAKRSRFAGFEGREMPGRKTAMVDDEQQSTPGHFASSCSRFCSHPNQFQGPNRPQTLMATSVERVAGIEPAFRYTLVKRTLYLCIRT
jgi:hypothetical protein